MIKFELDPIGDRLLVEMYGEKQLSNLILPDSEKQHVGRQRFFKVVGVGSGDYVQKTYKKGDLLLLVQGTQIATMKLGKDMVVTGLIEAHRVMSKATILEGEIFPIGEQEVLTPEQVDALSHPIHEPN